MGKLGRFLHLLISSIHDQIATTIMSGAEADVNIGWKGLFSLQGKVAVVTGGSRGLGLNAASGLLQAGCSQIFITSRKAPACEEAVAALNKLAQSSGLSGKAISIPADLAKSSEIERLEKVMDLNVKSVFVCTQKFAPLLRKRATLEDPSRIVITASIAGIGIGTLGPNATFGYSASKAAALHLARNLAGELGPQHILTTAICPGFFPTKMANGLMELTGGAQALADANPNKRLGVPEDIAGTIVYLCSRAGSHVNGGHIVLDGGALVGRSRL